MMEEKYQTFWRRFWAGVVDSLIFMPITFLDGWFFAQGFSGWINLLYYALFGCLIIYGYYIFMHGRYGQTVGKMLTRVKLLTLSEEPLGYRRALLRDSVPLLLSITFFLYDAPQVVRGINPYDIQAEYTNPLVIVSGAWAVAELVTMLTNKKRRAVHDFIAGSVVVKL